MLTLTLCLCALVALLQAQHTIESGWYKIVCRNPAHYDGKSKYVTLHHHESGWVKLKQNTESDHAWGLSTWKIRRLGTRGYSIESLAYREDGAFLGLYQNRYARAYNSVWSWWDITVADRDDSLGRVYYWMWLFPSGSGAVASIRMNDGHLEVQSWTRHGQPTHWGYVPQQFYFEPATWDNPPPPPSGFLKPVSYTVTLARGSNDRPTLAEMRYPFTNNVWFAVQEGFLKYFLKIGHDYGDLADNVWGSVSTKGPRYDYHSVWTLIPAGGSSGKPRFRLKNVATKRFLGVENYRVLTRMYGEIPRYDEGWIWEFISRPLHTPPHNSVFHIFRYEDSPSRENYNLIGSYGTQLTLNRESDARNSRNNFQLHHSGRDGRNPTFSIPNLFAYHHNSRHPGVFSFEFVKEDSNGNPVFLIYAWRGAAMAFCGGRKLLCIGGYSSGATSYANHYLWTLVPTDFYQLKREWVSGVRAEVIGIDQIQLKCSDNRASTEVTKPLTVEKGVETSTSVEVTRGHTAGVALSSSITLEGSVGFLGTGASMAWTIGLELSYSYTTEKTTGTSESKSETISEGLELPIPPNHRGCIELRFGTIEYSRKWMMEYRVRATGAIVRTYGVQRRRDYGWTLNALEHTRL